MEFSFGFESGTSSGPSSLRGSRSSLTRSADNTGKMKAIQWGAQQLRHDFPERYGITGRKPGQQGYVYMGWQQAIRDASAQLYPEGPQTSGGQQARFLQGRKRKVLSNLPLAIRAEYQFCRKHVNAVN